MRVMRRGVRAVLIALTALFCGGALADPGDVFYVNQANISGVEDGLSWATAHTTLQAGIQTATREFGGEVWVAQGTYAELRASAGTLRLRPLVDVYGGFNGTEASRNQRDWVANVTIIDGSVSNEGAPAANVVTAADNTRLDGFTIRGGRGESGAGLLNINNSPLIYNCIFSGNEATGFGGAAINVDGASPKFVNCQFLDNSAGESGGAVANTAATAEYVDCVFEGNTAVEAGGAIFNTPGANATIVGCTFRGNGANNGGAIFSDDSTPSVERCRFFDNVATSFGGAVFNNNGSDSIIVNSVFARNLAEDGRGGALASQDSGLFLLNCTISENEAGTSGGAVFTNNAQLFIVNSILWKDVPNEFSLVSSELQVNFSDVDGGVSGKGNLNFEPRFRNPATLDFSLLPQSNCINAGTDEPAPDDDIDGIARPRGPGIDMGAYEATNIGTPEPMPPLGCTLGALNPGGWPTPPSGGDGAVYALTALLLCTLAVAARRRQQRQAMPR